MNEMKFSSKRLTRQRSGRLSLYLAAGAATAGILPVIARAVTSPTIIASDSESVGSTGQSTSAGGTIYAENFASGGTKYEDYGVVQFSAASLSLNNATSVQTVTLALDEFTGSTTAAGTLNFYLSENTTQTLHDTSVTYQSSSPTGDGIGTTDFGPIAMLGAVAGVNSAGYQTYTFSLTTDESNYVVSQLQSASGLLRFLVATPNGPTATYEEFDGPGYHSGAAAPTLQLSATTPYTPRNLTWDPQSNNTWDTTQANFMNAGSTTLTAFVTQDNATFDDSYAVGGSVSIASAGVGPNATVVNSAGTYTFTGGPITAGSLTKSGPGELILNNGSNTLTGATTVNAGTLQAASANVLPKTSPITLNPGAVLDLNGYAQTVQSITMTGATISTGSAGLNVNNVTVNAGSVSTITGSYVVPTALQVTVTHNAGNAVDLTLAANAVDSTATTYGRVTFSGNGTIDMTGNNANFDGGFSISGAGSISPTVIIHNPSVFGTSSVPQLYFNAGTIYAAVPLTGASAIPNAVSFGPSSGSGTLSGSPIEFSGAFSTYGGSATSPYVQYLVVSNGSTTISGPLIDNVSATTNLLTNPTTLTSEGTGTLYLTNGSNSNTGTLGVAGGTLDVVSSVPDVVAIKVDANTAAASMILRNSGAISQNGTSTNIYLTSNGSFTPTLYINGGGTAASISAGSLDVYGSGSYVGAIAVQNAADSLSITGLTDIYTSTGVGGTLIKSGPGALTIGGPQTYGNGAALSVQGGTVTLSTDGGSSLSISTSAGANLNLPVGQTLASITNAGTASFTGGTSTIGTIAGIGSLGISSGVAVSTGALTQGAISNAGTVTVTGGTTNSVGAVTGTGYFATAGAASLSASVIRQSTLAINGTSTVTIPAAGTNASTSNISSLVLSSTGTLDLKNNDMVIDYNTAASPLVSVKASLAQAYDSGAYDQPGITSSAAKANPTNLRLGYAEASSLNNGTGTTVFDGQALTGGAVLVKYTLPGDTTLKGSVGLGDYNTVIANYNTGTLWTQGNFHYTGTTGLADYNSVIANYNSSVATTHALVGPVSPLGLATARTNLVALSTSPASPSLTLNAQLASDLRLEVNTASGDVSMLNTSGAAVSFTGYNIYDPSNNIQDSNNDAAGDPANEKLLSVASTAGGNTTPYRSSTNYRLWSVVKDNANTLSEGENNSRYVAGTATTYDTIVIPTGGSIDFGLVFGTATNVQDLTFQFSEPNASTGDPTTGLTFNGGVDYVAAPEPASFSILGIAAVGLLKRRRRNACSPIPANV